MVDWWATPLPRREVLRSGTKALIGVVGAGALALLGPVAHLYVRDKYGKKEWSETALRAQNRIKKRHGIEVNIDVPEHIEGEAPITPSDSPYIRMCAILEFEKLVNLYPPDTLSRFFKKVHIGDFPSHAEEEGFMTMDGETVAIRLRDFFVSYRVLFGELLASSAAHHEVGHTLTQEHLFDPEAWQAFDRLNPESEYYGAFKPVPKKERHALVRGYARGYGRQIVHEDIATIIELLFRGERAVQERLQIENTTLAKPGDPWHGVLEKKIASIKRIIEKKVPHMDEVYWKAVGTKEMRNDPIAYWNNRGVRQKNK